MNTYKLHTHYKKLLADTLTPVNIYLKLRDVFAGSILLEGSDYHSNENSLSFICSEPIASFTVQDGKVQTNFPDGLRQEKILDAADKSLTSLLEEFKNSFEIDTSDSRFNSLGLFGYTSYDAVRYFEDVTINASGSLVPDMIYKLYRYVIVVDHFHNEL